MKHRKFQDGVLIEEIDIPDPPATTEDVRAECQRRLMLAFNARDAADLAVKISNAQCEATRLQSIRLGIPGLVAARDWTTEEAAMATYLWQANATRDRLRACSNAMEPDPPADYRDDARWV